MDPLRCSSRVLKISQDDIDFNEVQQQPRKFNVTPAPISRPPSSSGNRLIKIQKIKANNSRTRHKWNDRFHIQTDEEKQLQPPPPQIYKQNVSRKKQINTYSNIHCISEKQKKYKSSSSSSIIPPIDIVSGKREWGKRTKKRAKWSMIKNNSVQNNNVNRNRSIQRTKWNKPPPKLPNTNKSNPLNESRSRVFQIPTKSVQTTQFNQIEKKEEKEKKDKDMNIKLNTYDKKEIADLFSTVLKNIIQNDDKADIQKKIDINNEMKPNKQKIEEKKENEEEYHNEKELNVEDTENMDNMENIQSLNIYGLNENRAAKKLLPITKRNKVLNQKRKQYLEPLDEVADIILDDLIEQISEELNAFCCQVVDTLIETETNV